MNSPIIPVEKLREYNIISNFYMIYYELRHESRQNIPFLLLDRFYKLNDRIINSVNKVPPDINIIKDADLEEDDFEVFLEKLFKHDTQRNLQYREYGKLGKHFWDICMKK